MAKKCNFHLFKFTLGPRPAREMCLKFNNFGGKRMSLPCVITQKSLALPKMLIEFGRDRQTPRIATTGPQTSRPLSLLILLAFHFLFRNGPHFPPVFLSSKPPTICRDFPEVFSLSLVLFWTFFSVGSWRMQSVFGRLKQNF